MSHEQSRALIENILRKHFNPGHLSVIDESAQHKGHSEAVAHPGAGHFKVFMKSALFDQKSAIERHRMVYQQLGHLMDSQIHALSLTLLASNECC